MTLKDVSDPPFVKAEIVSDDPDIVMPSAPYSSEYYSQASAPVPVVSSSPPAPHTTVTGIIPPQPTTTTTTTTTNLHNGAGVGRHPFRLTCPNCSQTVTTRTREQVNGVTILMVIVLLLVFWPLFWLPLCLPSCKSTEHYCTNCNYRIGSADPC
mmetsp:Transcript_33608/g.47752  ORF Transcript_33608/g.47752 Transcript_33608/m.47752 type:complete len:154 (+) Transcript_33608:20-481(+)